MPAAAAVETESLAARPAAAPFLSSPPPADVLYSRSQQLHAGGQGRQHQSLVYQLHQLAPEDQQPCAWSMQQQERALQQQERALQKQERALLQEQQLLESVQQQIEQPTFFELLAQHKLLEGLLAAVEHVVIVLREHLEEAELNYQVRQQQQLRQQQRQQLRQQQRYPEQHRREEHQQYNNKSRQEQQQQSRWAGGVQRGQELDVQQHDEGSGLQVSTARGAVPAAEASAAAGVLLGSAGAAAAPSAAARKRVRQQGSRDGGAVSRTLARHVAGAAAAAAARDAFCKWAAAAARLNAYLLQRLRSCCTHDAVNTCCSKWRQLLLWLLQRWVLLYLLLIAAVELQSLLSANASFPEAFYSIQRAQPFILRRRELQPYRQQQPLDTQQQQQQGNQDEQQQEGTKAPLQQEVLQQRQHDLLQQREQVQRQLLDLASNVRLSKKQIFCSVCFVLLPLLRRGLDAEYLRSSRRMATLPLQQHHPQEEYRREQRTATSAVALDAAATAGFHRLSSSSGDVSRNISCGMDGAVAAAASSGVRSAGSSRWRTSRSSTRQDGDLQETIGGAAGGRRRVFSFLNFLRRWRSSMKLQLGRLVGSGAGLLLHWLREKHQELLSDPVASLFLQLLQRRVVQLVRVKLLLLRRLAYVYSWLVSPLLQHILRGIQLLCWPAQHVLLVLRSRLWQPLQQLVRGLQFLSAWAPQKLLMPQFIRQRMPTSLQQQLLQSSRQLIGSAKQLLLLLRVAVSSREKEARAAARKTLQVLLQRWFVKNYRSACVVHDVVCVAYMLLYLADSCFFPYWSPYNHLLQLIPLRSRQTLLQLRPAIEVSGAARQRGGLLHQQQQLQQEEGQATQQPLQQQQPWRQRQHVALEGGEQSGGGVVGRAVVLETDGDALRRGLGSSSSYGLASLAGGCRCRAAASALVGTLLQQMGKATKAALVVVVFTLKVLEWWNEYEAAVAAAAAAGMLGADAAALAGAGAEGSVFAAVHRRAQETTEVPTPPPPPPPPAACDAHSSSHEDLVSLPQDKRLCPLCQQPKRNAACIPTGYTFCYRCITLHVRVHRRCPVSLLPVAESQIRRLYET